MWKHRNNVKQNHMAVLNNNDIFRRLLVQNCKNYASILFKSSKTQTSTLGRNNLINKFSMTILPNFRSNRGKLDTKVAV